MLSINLIQRHFEAHEHERLLRGLTDNGLPLPLPLRARLGQGPVAALALGLRRLAELTYGPTPLSRDMTAALLSHQRADGTFAPSQAAAGDADPLATAAAVAAMGQILQDHPAAAEAPLVQAHERALAALACLQDEDGLFRCPDDRTREDRALTGAFVLYLLARDAGFRAAVRWADLVRWYEEHADTLDGPTAELYRLACLTEPASDRPTPAVAAIAA